MVLISHTQSCFRVEDPLIHPSFLLFIVYFKEEMELCPSTFMHTALEGFWLSEMSVSSSPNQIVFQ